jgi:UDP-N-acetyl-D-mannosaminuronic acid dehydrogenase
MNEYAVAKNTDSLREVVKIINEISRSGGEPGIAVVINEKRKACGVITDGDIRSFFCKGVNFDAPVNDFTSKSFIYVFDDMGPKEQLESLLSTGTTKMKGSNPRVSKVVVLNRNMEFVRITNLFDLYRSNDISLKKISVYGMGYVGLTLALTFAESDLDVTGVDIKVDLIKQLRSGQSHFYEKGLDSLLNFCIKDEKISFQDINENVEADIHIIAVGTPVDTAGRVIYTYLQEAGLKIGKSLKFKDIVICRSTVPAGTTRKFLIPILERESGLVAGRDFHVAFAPERTVEGNALQELKTLPQVVGGLTQDCTEFASRLFGKINPTVVKVSSLEGAEIVKLINNTFRDTVFSFANDVAILCDEYNVNAFDVIRAANEGYPRNPIPLPSPGVGGICLVKDPLLYKASSMSQRVSFGKISRLVNSSMIDYIYEKLTTFTSVNNIKSKKVFILGMAFKGLPETSDMRFSPSVELLDRLTRDGFEVYAWDAVVQSEELIEAGAIPASREDGIKKCFATFIMNNHEENINLDIHSCLQDAQKIQAQKLIFFDGWGMVSKQEVESVKDVSYFTLGYITQR